MFEFLFKYPAESFHQGRLILALPWSQIALISLAILLLTFFALGYFRLRARTGFKHRALIALFRSLVFSLIIFSLLRPQLELSSPVTEPGLVGVLIDNSLSMTVRDPDGTARSDFIRQQFDTENGRLLASLQEHFTTRLFSFGENTESIADIKALDFSDGASNLSDALTIVLESSKGDSLDSVVVISDGGAASNDTLDASLLSLRSAGIPLYSIGVGQTSHDRDIEITRVKMPEKALKGSRVVADVVINQRGFDDQLVDLLVEDDSRILHKQQIRLKPGMQSFKIALRTEDHGPRQVKFHLARQTAEQVSANNSNSAMLSVDNSKMRILYFEGEPRFELKFIRRAVADDGNLQVSGLIRTADAKYYRVGIESRKQLRDGFPMTREELFSYHALILGSVEVSLLSLEQQQLIADFVSLRGGALLLLGGRHAFAEGGYRGTVLQDISPVVLADTTQSGFKREIMIQPVAAGYVHPVLLIADSIEQSIARWLSLPALTTVNPIRQIKPGATLLLSGASTAQEAQEDPYVALAFHRYGRGKVVAFPVQNSWLWRMHHDIELQDQTHRILWRQLLRWLVDSVPQRLSLTLSNRLSHAGGVIKLRSEVLDASFEADPAALPRLRLTAANGLEQTRPLLRDPTRAGLYQADISTTNPGDYRVSVEVDDKGERITSAEAGFRVTDAGYEFYQSEMNETLLRRISSETGGDFFTPDNIDGLVATLAARQRGSAVLVRHELWDMPVLFLLMVLLLCVEWAYRRWRGLI